MKKENEEKLSLINRIHAGYKLLISICIGVIICLLVPLPGLNPLTHWMFGWDCGCLVMIILSWISFFTISSKQIRQESIEQDEKRIVIFLIVVVSTLVSLAAVLILIKDKSSHLTILPIAFIGMMFSWIIVHTIFTFRYAHLYYGNDEQDASKHAEGLSFPEDKKPDYLDFAYFSFVIGMTFQVSDVEVESKRFRRLVLMHGLISFIFNTFIVALTINVIAGLTK